MELESINLTNAVVKFIEENQTKKYCLMIYRFYLLFTQIAIICDA